MENKIKVCQWCFEAPPIKNSHICQECLDWMVELKNEAQNPDFDLDQWLEEDSNE